VHHIKASFVRILLSLPALTHAAGLTLTFAYGTKASKNSIGSFLFGHNLSRCQRFRKVDRHIKKRLLRVSSIFAKQLGASMVDASLKPSKRYMRDH